MAKMSLESAQKMLDLLPDQPDSIFLYQIYPWWCILHYIMQAATILLLELSFGSLHMPEEEQNLLVAAKKAIRWLYSMSKWSTASRRAWQLCDDNLRRIAYGMNYDVSDMPEFVGQAKTNQPIRTQHHKFDQEDATNRTTTLMFESKMDNLSLLNLSVTALPEEAYQNLPSTSHPQVAPSLGMLSLTGSNPPGGDSFFPYDPIGGEFIRSFFPSATEEEPWTL
ncbi:hypothetical protein V6Z79_010131 [Aspergillus fumigatus]